MRVRKFATTFALVGLAVTAVACGAGEDGTVNEPAAGEETGQSSTGSEAEVESSVEDLMAQLAEMPYEERIAEIEAKAKEEGAVLLYASANVEQQEAWAEDFQELYPEVNILYVRAKSGDIGERLQAEARAGRHLADVVSLNAVVGAQLYDLDLFADHHGAPVPDGFPERYVEEWSVTQYINPNVITWNTDLVSDEDAPRELDDLLDPKWEGKVAIDVGAENFVAGLIVDRGVEGAEAYIQGLLDNGALVRRGHTAMTDLLAAGEFSAAVELYSYAVEEAISEGAPLDWVAPQPTAANATGVSLYKHSTRPHAAALLMHYMLTERGGQVIADLGRVSINPDVELAYPRLDAFLQDGTPESERVLPIGAQVALETFEDTQRILAELLAPAMSE